MPLLALPFPAIDPVLVEIGPFAVRWYALAYIGSILLGWWLLKRLIRGPGWNIPAEAVDDIMLWVTLGIILGGRLGYVLFYQTGYYLSNPLEIAYLWHGGMSFHGGLIGVITAIVIFCWRRGIPLLDMTDAGAPVVPIGLFFGRLANFINGELWGRPSDAPWAMVFPGAGPMPRHPSQLYEAALEGLVLFAVLQWLAWRPRRPEDAGKISGVFLIGYALARIVAEFFREPDVQIGYLAGGLTMGQLLCLPMLAVGLVLLLRQRRRGERGRPLSLAASGSAEALIRDLIAAHGPIDLARYMAIATQAYYAGRDPLGRAGDFTTGPEISQVFGELIGLAIAQAWLDRGRPRPADLVELGPGRGTLLADAARAWRVVPGFQGAVRLHLVETSPMLRALQGERLSGLAPLWHDGVERLPTTGPLFIIANEFLDTFPVRQFQRTGSGWRERLVDCDADGRLGFVLAGQPAPIHVAAADGAVLEVAPAREAVAASLAGRLAEQGGVALLIDYGEARTPFLGDTLQAVRGHAALDPMQAPGEADLTSHVDFAAVARAAAGAAVWGPIRQGDFLRRLGIDLRLDRLAAARPETAAELAAGCRRLVDADGMGVLFKVLALTGDELVPPGFEAGERWR